MRNVQSKWLLQDRLEFLGCIHLINNLSHHLLFLSFDVNVGEKILTRNDSFLSFWKLIERVLLVDGVCKIAIFQEKKGQTGGPPILGLALLNLKWGLRGWDFCDNWGIRSRAHAIQQMHGFLFPSLQETRRWFGLTFSCEKKAHPIKSNLYVKLNLMGFTLNLSFLTV